MIKANDPELQSWIPVGRDSDFPLQNIPFGIVVPPDGGPRAATRIGDTVIDLYSLAVNGLLDGPGLDPDLFKREFLNPLIATGKHSWRALRDRLSDLFSSGNPVLRDDTVLQASALMPVSSVKMLLPVAVGDYTDFYSSIEHATNVGRMFRDPAHALLPNWRHLPVGYHGRSSSIVVSGTGIHRPKGQIKAEGGDWPVFGPTRRLDFELEVAFITGRGTELGSSIPVTEAEDYIFGLVLFNDLSARDIQTWEYVPLGPFLSKNFGSVISPWIVTLDALEPFRVAGPTQEPEVLPYLKVQGNRNFNISLEVFIQAERADAYRICHSNFHYMYWNMAQQLAHQTVNGCNIRVGDIYASGTISGPEPGSYGSMLELAWKGTKPVSLPDGSTRTFLEDGDTVIMRGFADNGRYRIGFGEAVTRILPAI